MIKTTASENSTSLNELDWLNKWNQYSPHKVALVEADSGKQLTYSELFQYAVVASHYLKVKFNIQPHDRVVHFSTNEMSSFILFFALARLGATLVPINYRLTAQEVCYIIQNSDPRVIFYEDTFYSILKSIEEQIQVPESHWQKLVGQNSFEEKIENLKTENTQTFKSTVANSLFLSNPDTTALIIYTSGTTGFPKGAMISHQGLFWNSINTGLRLNITSNDSAVIFLPLFHTGGWNVLSTPFLHHGAQIILAKKFEADQVLQLSADYHCTLLFGVPTTMAMMSKAELFKTVSLNSIRYAIVGGEPMPLEQIQIWHNKQIPIRQGYGLTEFGPNVFSLNEQDAIRKMGSIGFPNFYVQVAVKNEQGQDVAVNEVGELWLKGPMCMKGYWRNEEATQATMANAWLKTGDLVRFDEENYFYVVGRKKEMYKSGGENVYPAEVEKVIYQCEGVSEVAVIGVPDEQWGEVGHAFISSKKETLTLERIKAHCVQNLAKFKNPKYITFLPELPKGDSGKILKRELYKLI